jgi:hypothetical protein
MARSRGLGYLLAGGPAVLLLIAVLFSFNGRGMLSTWTSLFYSEAGREQVQQGVTKLDVAYANLPAIQSGAWLAFFFVGLCALALWLYRSGKAGGAILLLVALVPIVDGVRFNGRFVDVVDPDQYFAPNAVSEFFADRPGYFRVMNFGGVQEDMLPLHHVPVVVGYHGNQLRWFDELLGGPGARNKVNPHLLNLAGARYLVMGSSQQVPEGYFGPEPVVPAADFGGVKVMENPNAFPRVYLCDRYEVVPDRKDIYPLILAGSDDFHQVVYLEKEPPLEIVADTSVARGTAEIEAYAIDSVAVRTEAPGNRLLVLTDNYYHAWHVTIDGEPAELLRAYGTFRAVAVPSGTHRVLFKYNSATYATGRLVTLVSLLFVAVVTGFYVVRRRRITETDQEQAS